MTDKKLNLGSHQWQILHDLGLHEWYLQPLKDDPEKTAERQEITGIVETITSSLHMQTPAEAPTTSAISTEPPTSVAGQQPENRAGVSVGKFQPLSGGAIELSAQGNFLPPTETTFSLPYQPLAGNWQAVGDAVAAGGTAAISASGSKDADIFIVIDPPTAAAVQRQRLLDDDENMLLSGMLAAVGMTAEQCYISPIVKQATPYGGDPDKAMLQEYLPLLLAEITLVCPRQVWLSGRIATQAILSTQAPLAQLMPQSYTLQTQQQSIGVRCLASLHYYLALPSQQSELWQWLKTVALR